MSVYSGLKNAYKSVLPKKVRQAIFRVMPRRLSRARNSPIRKLGRSADHDELYDERYYTDVLDATYRESCEVIADSIIRAFAPKSVTDVGCGPGQLLLAFTRRGIICRGLEYSSAGLKIARRNGLEVTKFDLRRDDLPSEFRSDVVVSTEVAEHLHEEYADRFVDVLCAVADNIVMTAAEPATTYVGDHTHLNEQPREYWIKKLEQRHFAYDDDITNQFRTEWKHAQTKPWFIQHLMVFHKEQRTLR